LFPSRVAGAFVRSGIFGLSVTVLQFAIAAETNRLPFTVTWTPLGTTFSITLPSWRHDPKSPIPCR
jgi:hypothetical protein